MKLLTKSRFIIGLQCPVWLWKAVNAKHELPEIDASTQAKFDTGNEVGLLAQKLYEGGTAITTGNFSANLMLTKRLIEQHIPLFEAGFCTDNLYCRVDILNPTEGGWDIIEVKSSTKAKEEHLYDLAFQKHVLEKSGLKINNLAVIHLNNQYVRQGMIEPEKLFTKTDVTKDVEAVEAQIPKLIKEQFAIINQPSCPTTTLTGQCKPYYDCPVHDELYNKLEAGNVFELYRGKQKATTLYEAGITTLKNIPAEEKLNAKQRLQVEAANKEAAIIDKEGLKKWLQNLQYPLHYLDFETAQFAIPRYDNTKPYQQLPVQWSLHIQQRDGTTTHKEFLAQGKEDPRPTFAQTLKEAIEETGSIIVYNQSFEEGRLKELAQQLPQHEEWIRKTIQRMQDLIIPFRNFHYHHPRQQGSCSLKYTLPATTGKDYKHLNIQDGGNAQLAYMRITYTEVDEEERAKVREDLLKYCCLDTEGMIWILEKLKEASE